ncbi:hypothetical protein GOA89_32580 [Sinorhizobium meliloti]|nr:hypothetical protein [Sinorhizobium meliloti]MDW9850857.1 hypothetical protein [Sinorhizobium meliloti]MDX0147649.1 hypothetical protein [Sinorhizobium meliloti]MDX0153918.1 hypothetical protein [Sinorhizobium meliloti]MDX0172830.1 hypothetical protein [Sinorhizobium meliloti]
MLTVDLELAEVMFPVGIIAAVPVVIGGGYQRDADLLLAAVVRQPSHGNDTAIESAACRAQLVVESANPDKHREPPVVQRSAKMTKVTYLAAYLFGIR